MEALYAVDRFEGAIAVLLGDRGSELHVARQLLPQGVREGSVLRVPVRADGPDWSKALLDEHERGQREVQARDLLGRLRRCDPGGDIEV